MLFFQYWSTFFSSILLFLSLSHIFMDYGSTDFFFMNYINYSLNFKNALI